eukprot:GHRQ01020486.1.p1 GENE.GHRQ01020486.1~~GHRQ01020486.1.p1  ORF type:complete len:161 (+),score=17.02 GHRQ01020486.1:330-812(+)
MLFNPTRITTGQLHGRHAGQSYFTLSVSKCGKSRSINVRSVAEPAVAPAAASTADVAPLDYNQLVREGHYEAPLVWEQVCLRTATAAVRFVAQSAVEMCSVHPTSSIVPAGCCFCVADCCGIWQLTNSSRPAGSSITCLQPNTQLDRSLRSLSSPSAEPS